MTTPSAVTATGEQPGAPGDAPGGAAGSRPAGAWGAGLALVNAGVLVGMLYFGRPLLVPMTLAVLLAFVLAPLVARLQRLRVGKGPAVILVVALALLLILGIGAVVGSQAASLVENLPAYKAAIQRKLASLTAAGGLVDQLDAAVRSFMGVAPAPALPLEPSVGAAGPAPAGEAGAPSTLVIVRSVVEPLFSPLATLGIMVVFVVFILLFREDLRDRLVRLVGRQDLHRTILAMNDAAGRLSRYFLIQLALNTGFGLFIGAALWAMGLPSPALWGLLAGLMRFVPFVGSFIAAAAPLLLALAVVPDWSLALAVLALFLVGDMIQGQVIEPLLYGHSTGLTPPAVVLSTAFWAFLWGPVGLLIATPLTVCLAVVGRYVESLAFLDVMFGDAPPLEPQETFYQRALEGNAAELAAQARKLAAETSLATYYDRVAMRGLALAQADLSRDALAFERLEAIHQQIEALLLALARDAGGPRGQVTGGNAGGGAGLPPPGWQADGAVLCIPGRGQLDDLAATMAAQVLRGEGFGARTESNLVLGAGHGEGGAFAGVRLCCLSVLEQGSSASGIRYLLRRIQRLMPDAAVAVCLWHAPGDSALLAALRSEGKEETIVLSLGELVALARAISARRVAAPAEVA